MERPTNKQIPVYTIFTFSLIHCCRYPVRSFVFRREFSYGAILTIKLFYSAYLFYFCWCQSFFVALFYSFILLRLFICILNKNIVTLQRVNRLSGSYVTDKINKQNLKNISHMIIFTFHLLFITQIFLEIFHTPYLQSKHSFQYYSGWKPMYIWF